MKMSQLIRHAAPGLVLVVGLILWQCLVSAYSIREVLLPSPFAVGSALMHMKSELWAATQRTALAASCGLISSTVTGVLIASVFCQSGPVRRTFYPYAILLQTMPIIALAPIVIAAFGRGIVSIMLISTILSLFPIITSTTTGLLQIDQSLIELFRLHSATRWQTFWKLRLPNAVPYLISGIRIASGTAIVGAIVGEFFVGSSQPGLGAMIQTKYGVFETAELYATVAVSTSLGITSFGIVSIAGDLILRQFAHGRSRNVAATLHK